jgi:choice-of-anchor B domain-containing protein
MKNIILLLFFPFFIFSQSSWNMNLLGSFDYPTTQGNDIWGWVDASENEFALVGLRDGVSCVDVTNPANPIEMFFIADVYSIWRDIKTYGSYAYVTTESDAGLLIIDLSDMSGNTFWHVKDFMNATTGVSLHWEAAHDLFIDENGICYIFGASNPNGYPAPANGAIFLDVASNPINPTHLGEWNEQYIHDGMARGDTMYVGCIYDGSLHIVDVSDKANPLTLGLAYTPDQFTHNAWVSDDGNYVFTTDEKPDAYLGSFDISDLNNIQEVDRIQSNPGGNSIPHNTFVDGNFLITSYYRDGTTVHDITHPNHMIQVGYYDSYIGNGSGYDGCWGTYPYLPSGNIISSDINSSNAQGQLLVYGRDFQQACYLQGDITDCATNLPISNASIQLINTNIVENSNLLGEYQTAVVDSGSYQMVYSAIGYENDTILIEMDNGVMITQDIVLCPPCSTFNIVTNNNVQICWGISYDIGNSSYNNSGTYSDTLVNYFGCDSIVNTNLTVLPNSIFSQTISFCAGDSTLVGSNIYNQTGVFTDTLVSSNGCDSIVSTNLTVYPIYNTNQSIDICNGDVYAVGQNIYNSSGTYYDTLNGSLLCDSIVITQLNVSNPISILSANPPLLNMQANGGNPPYDYQITGPNGFINTYQNVTGLQTVTPPYTGQYSFIVTDESGCQSLITTFNVDFQTAIKEYAGAKKLLLVIDLLGRKIATNNINNYDVLFFLYSDGTIEKKVKFLQGY